MVKGKSTWKYNKLLTARRNYYNNGGAFANFMNRLAGNPDKNGVLTTGPFKGMNQKGVDIMNGLGTAVGTIGGGLLSGGMTSTAGNVLSGLSGIAGAIPGPWGAVASAGFELLGGVTNRLFGAKLNEDNIAKVENNINELNSFRSDASDFDNLASIWQNAPSGMDFDSTFIGKDGVFSNKVKNLTNEYTDQINKGKQWVLDSLLNNTENITDTQMNNLLGNYTAEGGRIYIKPENRGKFTETKRRTGKTTEELTHSKNPLTRKRAVFAQNAKKWNHALGGELNTQGGDFSNGLLFINAGNSHEANPYGGVQMGVDPEGIPNLVEEGETIFNDYVFSRRLKVPKAVRNKYKLRDNISFSEASKKLSKESEERPNDPISQRGLEAVMADLAISQEELKAKKGQTNYAAKGGKLANKFSGMDSLSNAMSILGKNLSFEGLLPYSFTNNGFGYLSNPRTTDNNTDNNTNNNYPNFDNSLRYAPVLGSLIGLGTTLFSKQNNEDATAILEATKGGNYTPVRFNPVSNYLAYNPFDRNYYLNKLSSTAGATTNNLINTSGGNRNSLRAGLLAADNNFLNQIGALARQGEEYNLAQRLQELEARNKTDMFNSEGFFKAASANQSAQAASREFALKGLLASADIKNKNRLAREEAISSNMSNLFNSIGDIGREQTDRAWRTWAVNKGVYPAVGAAKGGKINKRKKGLTV